MSAHHRVRDRSEHLAAEASLGLGEARKIAADCEGINAKTAIIVPAVLGSMPFFWLANFLAIISLPAVLVALEVGLQAAHYDFHLGLASFFPTWLTLASVIGLVAWLAQTYIQLVALPVLQVSNNAQMAQTEEHAATILRGVERAEDQLNLETEGGLRALQEHIDARLDALTPPWQSEPT